MSHSLGNTLESYQKTVQLLLGLTEFPGVSPGELAKFKKSHGCSAFTCRFSGCIHTSTGFESDRIRSEHEATHTKLLKCTVGDCKYELPFSSTKMLKSHISKYHPALSSPKGGLSANKIGCDNCKQRNLKCSARQPSCTFRNILALLGRRSVLTSTGKACVSSNVDCIFVVGPASIRNSNETKTSPNVSMQGEGVGLGPAKLPPGLTREQVQQAFLVLMSSSFDFIYFWHTANLNRNTDK